MVLTFEPGLYFPTGYMESFIKNLKDEKDKQEAEAFFKSIEKKYKRYAGIGVRVEQCVVITKDGHELLTGDSPVEIDKIEELMSGK